MGVARKHYHTLHLVAAHLIFYHLIAPFSAHLYQAVTAHHYKLLPLRVMPMLPLCDAGLTDIYRYLSAIQGLHQLGKRAAVVDIHLEVEHGFFFGKVTEICAIEALGKAVGGNVGDGQALRLVGKTM